MTAISFFPNPDERALIVGQTGSGKTQFAVWLLEKLNRRTVIYDSKYDATFERYYIVSEVSHIKRMLEYENIVVFRPEPKILTDAGEMDKLLQWHYENLPDSICYIDEIYQFHEGNRPGPGLLGCLTRGRSRNISTIMSTQRPLYLSRFCLTESQLFYVFNLIDKKDTDRLGDVIPMMRDKNLKQLPKFWFRFYRAGSDRVITCKPVPYSPASKNTRKWL